MISYFQKGNYYHLFNRGCNKENIFFNKRNYEYLIEIIRSTHDDYKIKLISYCLLPNHYHLLLQQAGDISISKWMQLIFNKYVQAVNKQQSRNGTLFQGKFKRKQILDHNHLLILMQYIHYNPVKHDLVKKPEQWEFSSYNSYINEIDNRICDKNFIKNYFADARDFKRSMDEFVEAVDFMKCDVIDDFD